MWVCICIYMVIYYEKLAHMIMEAEKYHDMPSARWRTREAGSVIESKSESLRTRGDDDVNSD